MSSYLDSNGLLYLWQKIKTLLNSKVDVESGKGLSANDYTTAQKNKLASITQGADSVSFTRTVTSGTKIGTITINGTGTDMYYADPTSLDATVLTSGTIASARLPEASTSAKGAMSASDKTKLDKFGDADTYALKSDLTSLYKYKGTVNTTDALPTGATTGDVYNVEATGMNYAWDGAKWDALGQTFEITSITNEEIEGIVSANVGD